MCKDKRNLYNNPTGKPYCCQIECNKDAEYTIVYEGDEFYGYSSTQVCKEHIADLWDDGASLEPVDWKPNIFCISFKLEDE